MKVKQRIQRGSSGDDGVTLIELMLALVVLGLVLTGIVAGAISALKVTRINDQRAVASNLAQAEIERTRTLPFTTLQTLLGAEEMIEETDRGDYLVVREVTWSGIDSATDVCLEESSSVEMAVLRIDVLASPVADPDQVSRTTTTIARPPVNPAEDVGAISVMVRDHQTPSQPVSGVLVTVRGPDGSGFTQPTQLTPSSGCVLFVELATGNYEVEIHRSGHVGIANQAVPVRADVGVNAGERTAIDVSYAPAAELTLHGRAIAAPDALLPQPLPVTIDRANSGRFKLVAGEEHGPLWPGTWDVWAGDCPDADPRGERDEGGFFWPDAQRQSPVTLSTTASTDGEAELAAVLVELPASLDPYTISAEAIGSCAGGTSVLTYPGTHPSGDLTVGLPYGRWRVTFAAGTGEVVYELDIDPRLDWESGPIRATDLGAPEIVEPTLPEGGDLIQEVTIDGTLYRVHTFLTSGTFTVPSGVVDVEYLVVGGGGGGGGAANGVAAGRGGGGGGGIAEGDASVIAGTHTVLVGEGGAGGTGGASGSAGGPSSFAEYAAALGGGGGAAAGGPATSGASGGGGYYAYLQGAPGASGQGHDGGNGYRNNPYTGGGGGGASAAGSPGSAAGGGDGGAGIEISFDGLSTVYGSGGGGGGFGSVPGGAGGTNAGDAPATRADGGDASANTGSGGAGATGDNSGDGVRGGNGSAGIVIVRYPL